jgi:hypothetical protein
MRLLFLKDKPGKGGGVEKKYQLVIVRVIVDARREFLKSK